MTTSERRNSLEQQALTRLEQWVMDARNRHRQAISFPFVTMEVSDLERLLYYVRQLEYELDYRDQLAGGREGLDR